MFTEGALECGGLLDCVGAAPPPCGTFVRHECCVAMVLGADFGGEISGAPHTLIGDDSDVNDVSEIVGASNV